MQLTDEQRDIIIAWAVRTPLVRAVLLYASQVEDPEGPRTDVGLALSLDDGPEATWKLANFISHLASGKQSLRLRLGLWCSLSWRTVKTHLRRATSSCGELECRGHPVGVSASLAAIDCRKEPNGRVVNVTTYLPFSALRCRSSMNSAMRFGMASMLLLFGDWAGCYPLDARLTPSTTHPCPGASFVGGTGTLL